MDLWPGNGPLSKSVSSEGHPLGALTTEGSISQAACVQETQEGGFLQKVSCISGSGRGLSQLGLNEVALPSGRRLHRPGPQLTWETFTTHSWTHSQFTSTSAPVSPHPCFAG